MADGRTTGDSTPRPAEASSDTKGDNKTKKRRFFGLGTKKTDQEESAASKTPSASKNMASPTPASQPEPPLSPARQTSESSQVASPARSQIFERDVQDPTIPQANSPAIPTHIQTENHIPAVLDDASEAITNRKLDPDAVEIVTHASHQPASVAVTGAASPPAAPTPHDQTATEWARELTSFVDRQSSAQSPDSVSNYGSLDSADVRRLSFISFADVVQAEHAPPLSGVGSRESIHGAGLTSLPTSAFNRSPSPIRSPVSSQGPGTSPPTSNPGSIRGIEMSPARKPLGTPGSGSLGLVPPGQTGQLNVETMSQALRRTTSTDFSKVRSIPTSPVDGPGSR